MFFVGSGFIPDLFCADFPIQTELPEEFFKGASRLVKEGWFKDENEVFSEAIRHFLESHQSELMSKFIREDIE